MKKVLVYGSCVSRDLISLNSGELECIGYVARQSWISATNGAVDSNLGPVLKSAFQNRMLKGDLQSNALESLAAKIEEADFVLLDLIDDRFGVHSCNGGFVTPSAEFYSSGLKSVLKLGPALAFGTDEHFALWTVSADEIFEKLSIYNNKIFVLQAYYTDTSTDRSGVPAARGRSAGDWNTDYERYYSYLKNLGMNVLPLPKDLAITTPHHQWGIAPFHYVDSAYNWWLARVYESMAEYDA